MASQPPEGGFKCWMALECSHTRIEGITPLPPPLGSFRQIFIAPPPPTWRQFFISEGIPHRTETEIEKICCSQPGALDCRRRYRLHTVRFSSQAPHGHPPIFAPFDNYEIAGGNANAAIHRSKHRTEVSRRWPRTHAQPCGAFSEYAVRHERLSSMDR